MCLTSCSGAELRHHRRLVPISTSKIFLKEVLFNVGNLAFKSPFYCYLLTFLFKYLLGTRIVVPHNNLSHSCQDKNLASTNKTEQSQFKRKLTVYIMLTYSACDNCVTSYCGTIYFTWKENIPTFHNCKCNLNCFKS